MGIVHGSLKYGSNPKNNIGICPKMVDNCKQPL